MKKIESFQVDHTKFGVGMYTSRIDGDIITYDIRMVKPNGGEYLSSPSMHTIEHIFATYARSSALSEKVIYVGPMGCRTGFYLLVRDMKTTDAIELVRDALEFISTFEGEIPGYSEIECGNYLEHDLATAKLDLVPIISKMKDYTEAMLVYSWHFPQIQ